MRRKQSWHECPKQCSGRDRQRDLFPGEAERIKSEDKNVVLSGNELKCRYCSLVYRRTYMHNAKAFEILGWNDAKWEPLPHIKSFCIE